MLLGPGVNVCQICSFKLTSPWWGSWGWLDSSVLECGARDWSLQCLLTCYAKRSTRSQKMGCTRSMQTLVDMDGWQHSHHTAQSGLSWTHRCRNSEFWALSHSQGVKYRHFVMPFGIWHQRQPFGSLWGTMGFQLQLKILHSNTWHWEQLR